LISHKIYLARKGASNKEVEESLHKRERNPYLLPNQFLTVFQQPEHFSLICDAIMKLVALVLA